jgi:mannose-6-phosphate isomerase-like protein (cupin superfamily)
MTILNRNDAQPFTTADGSQIRELLNPRNSPLQNQSLAEATLSPNQCTTAHFHPQAEEIYFVVEGRGTIEIDGEKRAVAVGDAVAIPKAQTHRICNDGDGSLRFLCCCAPAYSHDDTILVES